MKTYKLGTIKEKYEIKEVSEYVFENIPDPYDIVGTERKAYDRLSKLKTPCKIELYIITAHAMAVTSVINAAAALAIPVTLMHYDRKRDTCFPQELGYLYPFRKNRNLAEYGKNKIR